MKLSSIKQGMNNGFGFTKLLPILLYRPDIFTYSMGGKV